MFCPNCGANNTTEQKFCRSCGLNLEQTARMLLEQIPSAQSADLVRYEKAVGGFGNFALAGLGTVGIAGFTALIWYLVSTVLVAGTNPYAAVLLIGFIVFGLLSLIFVILNGSLQERKAKINPGAWPQELGGDDAARETGKLLEDKTFIPAPSVTEDSTELLLKTRTRKLE